MTEISTRNPLEMSLDDIETEFDSLPSETENLDEYKLVQARRRELIEAYNSRQGEHDLRVGVKTRRILA